jgi:hypothetical protein
MVGATADSLPETLRDKIDRLDLMDYLHLIPRNLQVIFDKADYSSTDKV